MKKYNKLLSVAVATAMGLSVNVSAQDQDEEEFLEEVLVTGTRASLKKSMEIKRDSFGVVDAISAEDIGKFPDTNLAEALQRITGVSIDRSLGEGNSVTVRGFGSDFNLVTFNGRQMPTSSLGDGASPPSGRSYDFANIASEGIAGVEVYKTSRASVATGGIGSTINIKTARPLDAPGFKATVGAKAVFDTTQNDSTEGTPEISGLFSNTFADDTFGVAVSASYQRRKASVNQANVGWRDGYLGSPDFAGEWGALPTDNSWNAWNSNVENRPGDTDVYEIPQNANYSIADIDRERVNGQMVLQYSPSDRLTGTVDYTYSQNEIEVRSSDVGVWFNHEYVDSAWTDGPVAGPIFYTENFGEPGVFPGHPYTDLSMGGSLAANQSENKSLGINLEFAATDRLSLELDYHDSSAESKPTNQYGSNMSVGTTVISLNQQTVNFENDIPVISFTDNGFDALDPANRKASGSAFRNAYQRSDIDQLQLSGSYDIDPDIFVSGKFADSIDFGVSMIGNEVQSAFGVLQTDSWGGLGSEADIPDDIFEFESLPDKFDGLSGANDPAMIQGFSTFNFERMVDLLESQFGICSNSWSGNNIEGTCLAEYTTDRLIKEDTVSAYVQFNNEFELMGRPANLTYGGRYEETEVDSTAQVPVRTGTSWVSDNESFILDEGETTTENVTADYSHFLPSLNFDMQPTENVKVRAAWSKSITRPTYNNLQGGRELAGLFRAANGDGSQGDPRLPPNESKNFDLSAEWYYGDTSYISLGYFNKKVKNFVGSDVRTDNAFDLRNPRLGARAMAAADAGAASIRQYILDPANLAEMEAISGVAGAGITYTGLNADGLHTGSIAGLDSDPLLDLRIAFPVSNDQTATLDGIEFALQHTFGESGFGGILNYTIVNGDFEYDNTQSFRESQFTLTGLSDSANLIAFYDKNGLQSRIAYNWRDEFLSGNGPNPFYTEAYGQFDANISYEIRDGLTLFGEAINLTGENRRGHRRSDNNVFFASPGEPRYMIGARYTY